MIMSIVHVITYLIYSLFIMKQYSVDIKYRSLNENIIIII